MLPVSHEVCSVEAHICTDGIPALPVFHEVCSAEDLRAQISRKTGDEALLRVLSAITERAFRARVFRFYLAP